MRRREKIFSQRRACLGYPFFKQTIHWGTKKGSDIVVIKAFKVVVIRGSYYYVRNAVCVRLAANLW